jgi:hypothetical protein
MLSWMKIIRIKPVKVKTQHAELSTMST